MATVLKKYNFASREGVVFGERRSYPWERWLDGQIWRIEKGKDFDVEPLMMERIIRTRVSAFKMKVKIRHESRDDGKQFIVLQGDGDLPEVLADSNGAGRRGPSQNEVTKALAKKAAKAVPAPAPVKKVPAKKVAPAVKKTAPAVKAAAKAPAKTNGQPKQRPLKLVTPPSMQPVVRRRRVSSAG